MSAVVAVAAQASEPFYRVAGSAAFVSKEVKAKAATNQVLKGELFGVKVTTTCTAVKLAAGSKIIAATPGTSEETVEYSGCTQAGLGTGCEVKNKEVKTKPVVNRLVTTEPENKGFIDVLFTPKTPPEFVTIEFTGTCLVKEAVVNGTVAAEAWANGVRQKVGKNTEFKEAEVRFPAIQITKVFEGKVEVKPALTFGGNVATIVGNIKVTLLEEPVWSVNTE
jgi:hypothetical protein